MAASASACTFFRFRSLFATFFANSHGVAFRRFLFLKSLAPRVRPCPFPRPFPRPFPMPGKYQRLPTAGRDTPPPSTCIAPQSMRTHISVTSVFCRTCSQNANEYSTERFHRARALLARDAGPGRTTVLCRSARALLARDAGPVRLVKQSTRALANRSSRASRVHTRQEWTGRDDRSPRQRASTSASRAAARDARSTLCYYSIRFLSILNKVQLTPWKSLIDAMEKSNCHEKV